LKGCLKEEAWAAISRLSLSSENYKEAVSILRDRFGNEHASFNFCSYGIFVEN
jgi:hypothetical protein